MPDNQYCEQYRELTKEIERVIHRYRQAELFNGSAAVCYKGRKLVYGGYGYADRDAAPRTVTEHTRFLIGSNSKQFTAALIFRLAEQGMVDIAGHISDYLPYFRRDQGQRITLHQLLTHTSGIYNYTDNPDLAKPETFRGYTVPEIIGEVSRPELEFEPGSSFKYSNTNYFILGGIVEEVLGQPFPRVLQERLLDPLGLSETGYFQGDEDQGLFAKQYFVEHNGSGNHIFTELPWHRPELFFSAGNIYSSLADMTRWIDLLLSGQVIPERFREIAFKTVYNNYACGIVTMEAGLSELESLFRQGLQFVSKSIWTGEKVYRFILHRGALHGYNSFWMAVPELELKVVLLSSFAAGVYPEEMIYYMLKALLKQRIMG
ncbi:MAG: serine hydrolase domain-containing protein [Clostridia bacterium]|nr:serine hydrolase domain-containing protein [Clostridia bacterium]